MGVNKPIEFTLLLWIFDIIRGEYNMKKNSSTASGKPSGKAKRSIIASAATLVGVGTVYAFGALLKKIK